MSYREGGRVSSRKECWKRDGREGKWKRGCHKEKKGDGRGRKEERKKRYMRERGKGRESEAEFHVLNVLSRTRNNCHKAKINSNHISNNE